MDRREGLARLLGGTLATGILSAGFGTSLAFAEGETPRGRRAAGHPDHPGAESLEHRSAVVGEFDGALDGHRGFKLDTRHGELTVHVKEQTEYFHQHKHEELTAREFFEHVDMNDLVHVLGQRDDGRFMAHRVVLRRKQDGERHERRERRDRDDLIRTRGTVTAVNEPAMTVTVKPETGADKTFRVTGDTRIRLIGAICLKTGQLVVVVSSEDKPDVALGIKMLRTAS